MFTTPSRANRVLLLTTTRLRAGVVGVVVAGTCLVPADVSLDATKAGGDRPHQALALLSPRTMMPPRQSSTLGPAAESPRALLDRYCVTCHNERTLAGDLNLDDAEPGEVSRDPALWEKVAGKLRTGMMPPPRRPRPDAATYTALVSYFETGEPEAYWRNMRRVGELQIELFKRYEAGERISQGSVDISSIAEILESLSGGCFDLIPIFCKYLREIKSQKGAFIFSLTRHLLCQTDLET